MTREELFEWMVANTKKYPALDTLCETEVNGAAFLFLPGEYGAYKGLYLCFHRNRAAIFKLRRDGYAVGIMNNYNTAKKVLFERAKHEKRQARRREKSCGT